MKRKTKSGESPLRCKLSLRVQPRASCDEVAGHYEDGYKIRLTAAPVDGNANQYLIRFLAKRLGIAKSALRLAHGCTGRNKVVEIEGLSEVEVRQRMDSKVKL